MYTAWFIECWFIFVCVLIAESPPILAGSWRRSPSPMPPSQPRPPPLTTRAPLVIPSPALVICRRVARLPAPRRQGAERLRQRLVRHDYESGPPGPLAVSRRPVFLQTSPSLTTPCPGNVASSSARRLARGFDMLLHRSPRRSLLFSPQGDRLGDRGEWHRTDHGAQRCPMPVSLRPLSAREPGDAVGDCSAASRRPRRCPFDPLSHHWAGTCFSQNALQWKGVIKEAVQAVVIMTILDRAGLISQAKARSSLL